MSHVSTFGKDWGFVRRLISRGGGLYARVILGVDIRDLTGGYKCIRREVLEAIDMETVRAMETVKRKHVGRRAGDGAYVWEVTRRLLSGYETR